VTAEIINFGDHRVVHDTDVEIDLVTAVDVAVRDLREILSHEGAAQVRERLEQCEAMLTRAYFSAVDVEIHQPKCR
jgi:hypothetical protein